MSGEFSANRKWDWKTSSKQRPVIQKASTRGSESKSPIAVSLHTPPWCGFPRTLPPNFAIVGQIYQKAWIPKMTALTCCRKSYRTSINSPHNAQDVYVFSYCTNHRAANRLQLLPRYTQWEATENWVPQFTQTLKKQQRTWGQVTIVHLNSEYGSVCIANIALLIN